MCCSFSLSLPQLLLLLSLPSISLVSSTNQHANKNLQPDNMDPSELETLFNIMDTMSSDQNWRLSYPDPCKPGCSAWPGIECKTGNDNHLHVTRLDFGTLPNPTCKSTATFPSQIFSLPYLRSVFFFHCFTHAKTTISVSQKGVFNSSLQQLSLRSNPALIGPIPPQMSLLKSLQILTLSQNHLDGQIPAVIFSLSSLVRLDLSYNLLGGTIPYQLGNLRNLGGLDLSYNSLTGSIPDTIGQLGALQKLDLSSNLISGSIPDSIEKLNSLVFMALSNNRLGGKFPKGLAKLGSLQYFIMDDNPMFIPLPAEFGVLQKLQELRLANSGYSGTIPTTFSQLTNLSTLSLQNNRLTGEIPVSFGSLTRIYHLNLSRNFLGGVVPFNSSFFKRLGRNLDLSGNPGLCLSPSEAYGVKIGVSVCGSKGTSSMKKSEAPSGFSKPFFLFGMEEDASSSSSSIEVVEDKNENEMEIFNLKDKVKDPKFRS
ncbi:hypothetical protein F0562_011337 [Nyssa sinensis]|uniref:Leucine-rich repeat-containing N-terminal plant-type domain-containing protein n=1 Tax=Nyssa sinensis TaxID=561372 RepID=A0A5J5A1R9_9ASTE|nr:hypothetical protein F0562_011337 [Nyssa sinensis]